MLNQAGLALLTILGLMKIALKKQNNSLKTEHGAIPPTGHEAKPETQASIHPTEHTITIATQSSKSMFSTTTLQPIAKRQPQLS